MKKYDPDAWEKLGDSFTNNYELGLLDYRRNIIETILKYQSDFGSLLEIACADGWFIEQLRTRGFQNRYFGFDITPNLIDRARKRMPNEKFKVMDARKCYVEISPDRFDFVLCAGVLMHLHRPDVSCLVAEACRLSTKYVLFSTYGTYKNVGYSIPTNDNFINNVYSFNDINNAVPNGYNLCSFNVFERSNLFNIFQFFYKKASLP